MKLVFVFLLLITHFCKLSFVLGSKSFCFSAFPLLLALTGYLFSPLIATGTVAFYLLWSGNALITAGIPTLVATMAWNSCSTKSSYFLRFLFFVVIPLAAILAFCLHPIGSNAWAYSLYWLIPILIYGLERINQSIPLFFTALQITFIAHAIGSVLWIYQIQTTAPFWQNLVSIVPIERFVFALFSTLFVKTFVSLQEYLQSKNKLKLKGERREGNYAYKR